MPDSIVGGHIEWRLCILHWYWPSHWPRPVTRTARLLQPLVKLLWWLKPIGWWVVETRTDWRGEWGVFRTANDAAVDLARRAVQAGLDRATP